MTTPSLFNMDNYSDLIDTVVCTLFGTASTISAVWFLASLKTGWWPAFFG